MKKHISNQTETPLFTDDMLKQMYVFDTGDNMHGTIQRRIKEGKVSVPKVYRVRIGKTRNTSSVRYN